MHDLHGCRNIGRCRASRELCRPCRRPCADDLRGSRGACERISLHRVSFGEGGRGIAVTGGFDSMELMSRAAGHRLCRPNSTNKVVPYFRMALAIQYKFLSATYRLKRDLVPFAIPSRFVAVVRAVTF